MIKRISALLLCVLTVLSCLASCGSDINPDNPGAYISMYLTRQMLIITRLPCRSSACSSPPL